MTGIPREFGGRVALVTGAGQGMGRAVAERFAAEGAAVVLVDLKADRLVEVESRLRGAGARIESRALDVSDESAVQALVAAVVAAHGRLDILVNAAGIIHPTRFDQLSVREWDTVMQVNVRGTFLFMHEAYPQMKRQGKGSIVNFSSTAGLTVSTLGGAHYTASKHAVMGLTKAVAKEGGPFGVRVNAVCPGLIDTEMVRATVDAERIAGYQAAFPIDRLGTPGDVADLVLFLASDRSAYITGVGVNISGGDLL